MRQDYQIVAFTSNYDLVHAGVHGIGRPSEKTIKKLERKWLAWREEFLANHPGDYPLRSDHAKAEIIIVYPIGEPDKRMRFGVR